MSVSLGDVATSSSEPAAADDDGAETATIGG